MTPRLAIMGLLTLWLVGCSAAPAAPSPTAPAPPPPTVAGAAGSPSLNPPVHLTVVDNQTLATADAFIARDRGYYQQEGLNVDLIQLVGTPSIIQALATSQVDFAMTNPDPALFNALARGLDIKLLAALTRNKPGDHIASFLVRTDLLDGGHFQSPKDLKGKVVGVPAVQSQFYVNLVMQKDGLTADDVQVKAFQQASDLVAAFASKTIDAGWTPDPITTVILSQGLAKAVYVTGDLFPGAVGVSLGMSPSILQTQPEAVQRFVYATLRAHRDYYHAFVAKDADKAPLVQILSSDTPVKDPGLYDTIGMATVDPVPTMDDQSWNVLQEYFVKIGLQQQKVELTPYIDNSFIQRAADQLGSG
jgi:NitT/TauT family transport system substrate-binding protein